jgi:hypothetical protein
VGDQRAHPPHRRLLVDYPAVLGVRRDMAGELIELSYRRFVGV